MAHNERLSIHEIDPTAHEAVLGMESYLRHGQLEPSVLDLIKIRASQLNGCAYCLDMHNREAREHGEGQRRLDVLAGWQEARGFFSEREQAALALTEAVTLIAGHGVPDDVWAEVSARYSEKETVQLLMAISAINVWNRLAVSTHQQPPVAD